jgi:hypothetical protein
MRGTNDFATTNLCGQQMRIKYNDLNQSYLENAWNTSLQRWKCLSSNIRTRNLQHVLQAVHVGYWEPVSNTDGASCPKLKIEHNYLHCVRWCNVPDAYHNIGVSFQYGNKMVSGNRICRCILFNWSILSNMKTGVFVPGDAVATTGLWTAGDNVWTQGNSQAW